MVADGSKLELAGELRHPVNRKRIWRVPLAIRARRRPVKDVIGREVTDVGAAQASRLGHVAGPNRVDRIGKIDFGSQRSTAVNAARGSRCPAR